MILEYRHNKLNSFCLRWNRIVWDCCRIIPRKCFLDIFLSLFKVPWSLFAPIHKLNTQLNYRQQQKTKVEIDSTQAIALKTYSWCVLWTHILYSLNTVRFDKAIIVWNNSLISSTFVRFYMNYCKEHGILSKRFKENGKLYSSYRPCGVFLFPLFLVLQILPAMKNHF